MLFPLLTAGLISVDATPAHADAPAPFWWNGTTCDTAHYQGSYPLGASFNGVQACGPGPNQGGSDHLVNFGSGAGEYEWECVELSMRYMYLAYGIAPWVLPGGDAYNIVTSYSGNVLTKDTNPAIDGVPTPGDVLAFAANSFGHGSNGHTAVVTAVHVGANGNGTITTMEQNASSNGVGSVPVSGNVVGGGVTGWLHDPSNTPPPNYVYHVFDGTTSGSLHETYWGGGDSLTSYQLANVGSPVTSIFFAVTSNGVYHVFSGTSAGTIYETYWGGGDSLTSYPLANVGSPIASIQFAVTS